jgi:methanogenic corrinoid protein MtbC1
MSDYRSPDSTRASCVTSQDALFDGLLMPKLDPCVDHDLLHDLYQAAKSGERSACDAVIKAALNRGQSPEDIADHYIPAASRMMGDAWCADTTSFAQVTIGTSRLQAALRSLGPDWVSNENANPDAPTVLVLVAKDVAHTLGATVLAGQLRRRGISVRIIVGVDPTDIGNMLHGRRYDAVFLSASCGESLKKLRLIVEAIRTVYDDNIKVVVGGAIVTDQSDVKSLTGASFVTDDVDEAINLCELKTSLRKSQLVRS